MRTEANLGPRVPSRLRHVVATVRRVDAVMWSDYLCPWCYVGRDRTTAIEQLGLPGTGLPSHLHPERPPAGRRVRPDGRLAPVLDRIEAECEAAGMAFRRPTRMPNTR